MKNTGKFFFSVMLGIAIAVMLYYTLEDKVLSYSHATDILNKNGIVTKEDRTLYYQDNDNSISQEEADSITLLMNEYEIIVLFKTDK